MHRITFAGNAGTGTSTVGELLARELQIPFQSAGNFLRNLATERGKSLEELHEEMKLDPTLDRLLDDRTRAYGMTHKEFVFEARLAWYFVPETIKFLLVCQEEVRFARVAERQKISFEQARQETLAREKKDAVRYATFYRIDNHIDSRLFDCILDTTHDVPEGLVEKAMKFIRSRHNLAASL